MYPFALIQVLLLTIKSVCLEAVNATNNILDTNNEVIAVKLDLDTVEKAVKKILRVTNNIIPMKTDDNSLEEHTAVTSNSDFPYMCAVLRKSMFVSSGALIDDSWVLTGADALFLIRESARELRVRLGSINYKEGGILTPIKFFVIHPYFTDETPMYDIALIKLPQSVTVSLSLRPIRAQINLTDVTAKHFIVTAWRTVSRKISDESSVLASIDTIKSRRILRVSHMHSTDSQRCKEETKEMGINAAQSLMCLDPGRNSCQRVPGAPVVLNGILWGIVSSWLPEDCDPVSPGPSFATLLGAPDISTWIQAILIGRNWTKLSY